MALVGSVAIGLMVLLGLSALAVFYLTRLPPDHFASGHTRTSRSELVWSVLGWICILAGVAMLVLPGQGLITLLAGLLMAEYPGKRRVEGWVFGFARVRAAVDSVRVKAGRLPLEWPEAET